MNGTSDAAMPTAPAQAVATYRKSRRDGSVEDGFDVVASDDDEVWAMVRSTSEMRHAR
jgi:hypothetical protein